MALLSLVRKNKKIKKQILKTSEDFRLETNAEQLIC
jgi:hypothetical protein